MGKVGETVFVTWACDGSGVAIRAKARVTATWRDTVRVKFDPAATGAIAELGRVAVVDKAALSKPGSYPAVASFGWLD